MDLKRAAYQWLRMYVKEASAGSRNVDPEFTTPSV